MEKEITEGNRLIAEFMGGVVQGDFTSKPYPKNIPNWAYVHCDFDTFKVGGYFYHSSWDWIMPVIEKIEGWNLNLKDFVNVRISQGYVEIEGARGQRIFKNTSIEGSKIKATWLAVVDFIKWYNSQSDGTK